MKLSELIKKNRLENSSYEDISTALNKREAVPNPDKQRSVLKPLASVDELFYLVFNSSVEDEAANQKALATLSQYLANGKLISEFLGIPFQGHLIKTLDLMVTKFGLGKRQADAVKERLTEVIPDPSWSPTVLAPSLAQEAGLGIVTLEDIQLVMADGVV